MGKKSSDAGLFDRFTRDERGGLTMQMALAFGVLAIAGALFLAPAMQGVGDRYANNYDYSDGYGIDRTVTGSVSRSQRYTVRRSVFSNEPEIICGKAPAPACPRGSR